MRPLSPRLRRSPSLRRLRPLLLSATVAAAALGGGCGGNQGNLSVSIIVPPGVSNPFLTAAKVRITVGDKQSSAPVTSGSFQVKLDVDNPPQDSYTRLLVEALDAQDRVLGRGRTPDIVLLVTNASFAVYVGRPGQATPTEVKLADDKMNAAPRKELAGVSLRGRQVAQVERAFGALIIGGSDDGGVASPTAWLYDPLQHQLSPYGTLKKARRGAVIAPSADSAQGQQAILWGGVDAGNVLLTDAVKFDPHVSSLTDVWAAPSMEVADAGAPGSYLPTLSEDKDGTFLVSGGSSDPDPQNLKPQAQAVLLRRNPAPAMSSDASPRLGVTRVPPAMDGSGPMLAPRALHSATPVLATEGRAALLFGGLSFADATTKPVAELFLYDTQKFIELKLAPTAPALPAVTRRGHLAYTLQTGKVLIAGGYTEDGTGAKTLAESALIIDPKAKTFEERPGFFKTPRRAATINQVGDELLVCGGFDKTDKAIADCEMFSLDAAIPTRTPTPLPTARAGHLALLLETDQMLLVGGVGSDGKALASIDIYSAR